MAHLAAHQLLTLLRDRGLKVIDGATIWVVDGKLYYSPESGHYRLSRALGGAKGTVRGSPESNAEQIEKLCRP